MKPWAEAGVSILPKWANKESKDQKEITATQIPDPTRRSWGTLWPSSLALVVLDVNGHKIQLRWGQHRGVSSGLAAWARTICRHSIYLYILLYLFILSTSSTSLWGNVPKLLVGGHALEMPFGKAVMDVIRAVTRSVGFFYWVAVIWGVVFCVSSDKWGSPDLLQWYGYYYSKVLGCSCNHYMFQLVLRIVRISLFKNKQREG